MIGIKVRDRLAERGYAALADRVPMMTSRALNKTGASALSPLIKAVSADVGIKQKTVRDEIKITPAVWTRPIFRAEVSGKRIPLIEFKAKWRRSSGVTAKIPGGRGHYPTAFIARIGGRVGVFVRVGPKRSPTWELTGPSLPKVVGKFRGLFFDKAREVLQKNLQHEINYETRLIAQASNGA